jgi:hypothetical protein
LRSFSVELPGLAEGVRVRFDQQPSPAAREERVGIGTVKPVVGAHIHHGPRHALAFQEERGESGELPMPGRVPVHQKANPMFQLDGNLQKMALVDRGAERDTATTGKTKIGNMSFIGA